MPLNEVLYKRSLAWLYDIVYNKEHEIVALYYHQIEDPYCLSKMAKQLRFEGLELGLSNYFITLEKARQHAWRNKNKFHKGLD